MFDSLFPVIHRNRTCTYLVLSIAYTLEFNLRDAASDKTSVSNFGFNGIDCTAIVRH